MSLPKVFPCNTCVRVFEGSQAQRAHMREPWHVYNLKRRMASLPPISADVYYAENVAATSIVSSASSSSSSKQESLDASTTTTAAPSSFLEAVRPSSPPTEEEEEESDETGGLLIGDQQAQINLNRCLFCTNASDSLEANVEHMYTEHGLYIPEIEHLSSLETIVGYLRTVITEYKECLYCGMIKQSAEGVRRHMLDKGHCMINLEREPELLEFWDFSDDDDDDDGNDTDDDDNDNDNEEVPKSPARKKTDDTMAASKDLSQGEYILPSGKVVSSKDKARDARLFARRTAAASLAANDDSSSRTITTGGNPIDNTTGKTCSSYSAANSAKFKSLMRRTQGGGGRGRGRGTHDHGAVLAVRDAVGLVGVSGQQIQSLITVQRKMQRQQALVQASAAWAGDKGGIHQRHYKVKMNLRDG